MNDEELRRFVERLADREALDWNTAERRLGASQLRGLRRVESIVSAYRRFDDHDPTHRFQRLLLHERIGGGFGGEVWRAHDPLLERDVALKLRGTGAPDLQREARLLEEARALARIDHVNVLRVLGADVAGGRLGVWSEYIDGEDLETRMHRDGRIGAEEARSLGAALCGALAAVHAAGFLHGDVKPSNVMRTRDGRHVLCDLGSAVPLRGGETRALASGSPLYLAPEVLAGGRPGVASDLYALGATLFHLLGGRAPVEGEDLEQLAAAHRIGKRHRLRELRPDLPGELVAAVERAVDPDPARRFAGAGAFEAALASRPAKWRPFAFAAMAAAALVLVGLALHAPAPGVLASEVRWSRGDATPLYDGAGVRRGDTLYLDLRCTRACWAYVFAEDGTREVSTLFPLPTTRANPQTAGTAQRLPGRIEGSDRHWRIGPASGSEERVLLVVADAAVSALETTDANPLALAEGERYRGVDAVVAAPPPALAAGLDALAARLHEQQAAVEMHWLRLRRTDLTAADGVQSR
ncbi:serine/threonine protein kinase [Dokdonella ginsengisoli]|uniref:Protein kinase n=1 Tax=Dokdonella ginsengisoli TaxID=363846 RepID=A0ABV9QXI0_9GAMM